MHMGHSVQTRRCRRRRRGTYKRTTGMRNLLRYSLLRRCFHDMKGRRPRCFNLSTGEVDQPSVDVNVDAGVLVVSVEVAHRQPVRRRSSAVVEIRVVRSQT